jgi:rod shape-determining protein MreC
MLILIAVTFSILESSRRAPLEPAKGVLGSLLSPAARVGSAIHNRSAMFWGALLAHDQLATENEELRRQLTEVRLQNAIGTAESVVSEARARIAPVVPRDRELLDAAVLGFAPSGGRQFLWISIGSDAGIEPGMIVLGANGVLGSVHRVFAGTSLVELLGDAKSRWGALSSDTAETALLAGDGKPGIAQLLLERPTTQIHPGEILVTTGQAGSAAPGGLVLGTMLEMGTNKNGEPVGIVELAEDPTKARIVFVLTAKMLPSEPPTR